MPRPLRAGERAPACGDVREMVDAGRCAGRRARRARCCGYMAMWRVCDAERWIGDGVVDEYNVLSLSKTRLDAHPAAHSLGNDAALIRSFFAHTHHVGHSRVSVYARPNDVVPSSLARKRPRDTTTLHAAHPSALT